MASDRTEGLKGQNLRTRAAQGTVINAAFTVALQFLGFLKGFIVAGFLVAHDYGIWGLLVISLGTLLWLTQVGIDDKYIQQDHADQEKAFRLAFTLNCILAVFFMVVFAVGIPLFALAYDEPDIVAPGLLLALGMPSVALSTPVWIFYRRMEFLKQRRLQLWDPLVGFVVTIGLAAAGAGYWALVIGTLAGGYAAAIAAVVASPIKLGFYFDREVAREWVGFSWPLLVSSASGVLVAQIPILVAQRHMGTAAVGALTLAGTISLYAKRVDDVVTGTLYPVIAAAKDRRDLLFEAFSKSNRLALLWGVPCGVGVALFTPDLVHYAIGDKWEFAIPVIQIYALTAGFNQFAFNWSAFYKALNRTRPMAVASGIMLAAVLALCVPMTLAWDLKGYAWGMAAATAVYIGVRCYYLAKIFPGFKVLSHAARSFLPTVPAVLAVFAARELWPGDRSELHALAEILLYGGVLAGATMLAERVLIRELVGYVRAKASPPPEPEPEPDPA